MPRKLRYIPEPGTLVEVTCRTVQARYLLRPSPELVDLTLGILGRAQRLCGMRICAFVFLSNHAHLLLDVDDAQQLARFMNYVNGNLAREAGRLVDWRDKFWARRYEAIVISPEAEASRLGYLLKQGVKEGLVERPQDWPGAHSVGALLEGGELVGHWFNRSREYAARRSGKTFDRLQFAERETVTLSPLPCWRELSQSQVRERVSALVEQIVEEARAERAVTGESVAGVDAVKLRHPHERSQRPKRSPAPAFHALTPAAFQRLRDAYNAFVARYRAAAERLRSNELAVGAMTTMFPEGCFPPPLPFVEVAL